MAARRKKKKPSDGQRVVGANKKARRAYDLGDRFEAGIALMGTEVKALRFHGATLGESYAQVKDGEIWLVNCHIPEYLQGNRNNHEPTRPRRLLLHRREIRKMAAAVQRQGMTLVPLQLYFNRRGRAKLELALAKGRKLHDKRRAEKDRDWARRRARLMRTSD